MITVDRKYLDSLKGESYAAWRGDRAKVLFDDVDISNSCIYCNIDLDMAIVAQRTLDGTFIINKGEVVYETVIGKVYVEPINYTNEKKLAAYRRFFNG